MRWRRIPRAATLQEDAAALERTPRRIAASLPEVFAALKQGVTGEWPDALTDLRDCGFFVAEGTDKSLRAKFLHQSQHRTDMLHLVVLPTEACNFDCTYCYQTFPRGKMTREVIAGLQHFVRDRARFLRTVSISWFGGEPLLAPEIIGELSASFLQSCAAHDVEYTADIATNGYHLTPERFLQLLHWRIRRFMVTLDGPAIVHGGR